MRPVRILCEHLRRFEGQRAPGVISQRQQLLGGDLPGGLLAAELEDVLIQHSLEVSGFAVAQDLLPAVTLGVELVEQLGGVEPVEQGTQAGRR